MVAFWLIIALRRKFWHFLLSHGFSILVLLELTLAIFDDSLAAFYYTEDGRTASTQIWEETMQELSFAKVLGIIEGLKR